MAAAAWLSQQLFCVFPHRDWPQLHADQRDFDAGPRPNFPCATPHWLLYAFVPGDWSRGLVVKAPGLHSPFCDCSVECTGAVVFPPF